MHKTTLLYERVIKYVRSRHSLAAPSRNFVNQLRVWEECKYDLRKDKAQTEPKAATRRELERMDKHVGRGQVCKREGCPVCGNESLGYTVETSAGPADFIEC